MEHHENVNATPEEKKFREYMNSGEDFLRIELYRPARNWFKRALETGIDNKPAQDKIDYCTSSIMKEQRTIVIIASVVVVIMMLIYII